MSDGNLVFEHSAAVGKHRTSLLADGLFKIDGASGDTPDAEDVVMLLDSARHTVRAEASLLKEQAHMFINEMGDDEITVEVKTQNATDKVRQPIAISLSVVTHTLTPRVPLPLSLLPRALHSVD